MQCLQQVSTIIKLLTVVQLDSVCGQVLACAMVKPLGAGCDNEVVSELAAFCVHPDYRGSGRGDSLLAYLGNHHPSRQSCTQVVSMSGHKLFGCPYLGI